MENKLNKRYGLFTAICMVVGIVMGSGIFFKAQDMLKYTGGNVPLGILAWLIGGAVMIICSCVFAIFATKYEKVNGVVDYAEAIVGKKYGFTLGWFVTTIYYPAMTAVLAWVSARYTLVLFGNNDITGGLCIALALMYLVLNYALNMSSPKLAGKFQVSTTVIKMVPLVLMAVVGTIAGLINGNTIESIKTASNTSTGFDGIFGAIVAGAFAYEGWIIATSINSELKNAKKNLPIALVVGSIIVVAIYVLFFIGVTGSADVNDIINKGTHIAFENMFGNVAGTILNVFVVISCLGTLNGLMMASTRSMYSLAIRKQGPETERFSQVDNITNMPTNSGIIGLALCAVWFFYFYGANLSENIFGVFSFDSSELPIITIYALYIPIFIIFIKKEGKKDKIKNILLPILAIIASIFMIFSAFYAHGIKPYNNAQEIGEFSFPILFYLIVFIVIMGIGFILDKKSNKDIIE